MPPPGLRACQAKAKQGAALAAKLQRLACKAGCAWGGQLRKWVGLQALLSHPGPEAKERWQKPSTKEYGSIFQGFGEAEGKNVCWLIPKREIPSGEQVTYPRAVAGYRPEKAGNPWRARITAGGGKLDYEIGRAHV